MAKPLEFMINKKKILVTESHNNSDVLNVLNKFLKNISNREIKVIGFWSTSFDYNSDDPFRLDTIAICDGEVSLVCALTGMGKHTLTCLANFLRLPYVFFVGSGIKLSMQLLAKDFGLCCENVVELGPLANGKIQLPSSPGFDIDLSPTPDQFFNSHTKNQIFLLASTAYSYYDIGSKSFGEIVPSNNGLHDGLYCGNALELRPLAATKPRLAGSIGQKIYRFFTWPKFFLKVFLLLVLFFALMEAIGEVRRDWRFHHY